MFNKIVLVGHLTRDIELRYTQSGAAIGSSGIAVTRKYTLNGEKREETCFIDITFFGKHAEIANQYLNKGSKLLVEGRLKFDQWQDSNGQNRSKHSVVVEVMEMLGEPKQSNQGYQQGGYSNQRPQQSAPKKAQQQKPPESYDAPEIYVDGDKYDNDETIPF
ncbi:single-stranded DNA-binding protein [Campylobacter sp. FOBRC14]|uniref:single-stranded DNA-binding protein n=1 Tax=Campylobacter sp. FOBRC14 TaxID=936554 RepID=UPI00027A3850|nr:single-stranded DNA-binding protein [Campylobacter sp. FOBRC14]EJP74671.1 single-stranded DNA-binding protein [Campylobacter sp. FOBRC14]